MLHITVQLRNDSLLLDRIREDSTSKWQFFWFLVSSWGTHLSSFFTFPICFKCRRTVDWLTLSSWATSCVVVRGSASMMLSIHCCQLPMAGHYVPHCQDSSPVQNFLNHHCTVHSLAVPGPNAFVDVSSCLLLLDPFWTQIKKSLKFAFVSNIISIV